MNFGQYTRRIYERAPSAYCRLPSLPLYNHRLGVKECVNRNGAPHDCLIEQRKSVNESYLSCIISPAHPMIIPSILYHYRSIISLLSP